MALAAFYLDHHDERASRRVVEDLGVLVALTGAEDPVEAARSFARGGKALRTPNTIKLNDPATALSKEHTSASPRTVVVMAAGCQLDVRDSVNAWVRLQLAIHTVVHIPSNTYVRWVPLPGEHACELVEVQTGTLVYREPEASEMLTQRARIAMPDTATPRDLVCELCQQFYKLGWVSGTGGSISVRHGERVYMAPSGVQKERMHPEDIFVTDLSGDILCPPRSREGRAALKLSQCAPLFLSAFLHRQAGAVIHSHSINAVMATTIYGREFVVTHQEMIKGLAGHGYHDRLVIPIIENTAHESDLTESLTRAIRDYPAANAVLVRRHGLYVWGKDWVQAKTQAECLDYLLDWAVRMHNMGLDASQPPVYRRIAPALAGAAPAGAAAGNGAEVPSRKRAAEGGADGAEAGPAKRARGSNGDVDGLLSGVSAPAARSDGGKFKAVLLDIEGTTTPITFVADVLFPYARRQLRSFVERSWRDADARQALAALHELAAADAASGVAGVVPVPALPALEATAEEVAAFVSGVVGNVEWQMSSDRKSTALKLLQGLIWRGGYQGGELRGQVYDDTVAALQYWNDMGLKVYIYSSGSREAQRLLFGHSTHGDLRPLLCGFFDTTVGAKVEAQSYREIVTTLGADGTHEVIFATDNVREAIAAREAGMEAVLMDRPGNAPLPPDHGFRVERSLLRLLQL